MLFIFSVSKFSFSNDVHGFHLPPIAVPVRRASDRGPAPRGVGARESLGPVAVAAATVPATVAAASAPAMVAVSVPVTVMAVTACVTVADTPRVVRTSCRQLVGVDAGGGERSYASKPSSWAQQRASRTRTGRRVRGRQCAPWGRRAGGGRQCASWTRTGRRRPRGRRWGDRVVGRVLGRRRQRRRGRWLGVTGRRRQRRPGRRVGDRGVVPVLVAHVHAKRGP